MSQSVLANVGVRVALERLGRDFYDHCPPELRPSPIISDEEARAAALTWIGTRAISLLPPTSIILHIDYCRKALPYAHSDPA